MIICAIEEQAFSKNKVRASDLSQHFKQIFGRYEQFKSD